MGRMDTRHIKTPNWDSKSGPSVLLSYTLTYQHGVFSPLAIWECEQNHQTNNQTQIKTKPDHIMGHQFQYMKDVLTYSGHYS